jgi:hypothetical protein
MDKLEETASLAMSFFVMGVIMALLLALTKG